MRNFEYHGALPHAPSLLAIGRFVADKGGRGCWRVWVGRIMSVSVTLQPCVKPHCGNFKANRLLALSHQEGRSHIILFLVVGMCSGLLI